MNRLTELAYGNLTLAVTGCVLLDWGDPVVHATSLTLLLVADTADRLAQP